MRISPWLWFSLAMTMLKVIHYGPRCPYFSENQGRVKVRDYARSWRFCYECAPEEPPHKIDALVYAVIQKQLCQQCWTAGRGPTVASHRVPDRQKPRTLMDVCGKCARGEDRTNGFRARVGVPAAE